jgi:hypothetical protein
LDRLNEHGARIDRVNAMTASGDLVVDNSTGTATFPGGATLLLGL